MTTDIKCHEVACRPFSDQRPGTAGLRKKVAVFQQPHYLETFAQAIFSVLKPGHGAKLVIGGDGRYFNARAIQTIAAISVANGIRHLVIGKDGLLSTPAASNLIRCSGAAGGIILTASHNPGGPDGDFGIKLNIATGGQATEQLTESIYQCTLGLTHYTLAEIPELNLAETGRQQYGALTVEVVDPVDEYAELMEQLFDFELIRASLRKKISLHFDALNAVTGPYARRIFCDMLGAPEDSVVNATPLPDFGGLHPDPNPVDAKAVYDLAMRASSADLFAASDGDGDRNMILGPGMLVSPGDSLAIMLANTVVTPGYRSGVPGVARSMPTSRAVDQVAKDLNIPCYETPTGWRFFSNLLENGDIGLCGEESFGTSSAHAREKDGLWAVLFWLNMLAALEQPLPEIVRRHWSRYGRCFFQRRDYFVADTDRAQSLMAHLQAHVTEIKDQRHAGAKVILADEFRYEDPVDHSVSEHQGIRVVYDNGGRMVFRLSGTGTAGATLRVYLDHIEPNIARHEISNSAALAPLASVAEDFARIAFFTGLTEPTAII